MSYTVDLPVRFADVDHARVAYFPRLLNLVHVAMEEFFAGAVGRTYAEVLLDDRIGFPTVHLDCDFNKPLRFGDVARFVVSIDEIGRRKVVFRYKIHVGEALHAEVVQTTVCIDPEAFVSRDIPGDYYSALERHVSAP